jgi:hypothetical protein
MESLALVEEADRPTGLPEWIARSLNVKPGRDPIGLQTITLDRIMPILLPGILVLSRRARYFTFFPFLLQTFRELQLPRRVRKFGPADLQGKWSGPRGAAKLEMDAPVVATDAVSATRG